MADQAAASMAMAERLYPLHRSITGAGARETLRIIAEDIPLEIHEVATGTPALDWVVPSEWQIRDAWVETLDGRRVIDYAASNLHVVGYSQSIDGEVDRATLLEHLHTRPDLPDAVPYRTSPFRETWGFCAPHRLSETLTDARYRVRIDASHADGSLSYGECFLPGTSSDEIVITTHTCHPSMANDNVSGMVVTSRVAARLGAAMASAPRRLGIRFLFLPGTIGSIAWLSRNEANLERIRHGLVVAGVGDAGPFTYKGSFSGKATVDRAVETVLGDEERPHRVEPFTPWGYDERQFNSPGYRLPFGRLSRTPHGAYPESHTSADDLAFISGERLVETDDLLLSVIDVLERDRRPMNLAPRGEPRLGARGLMSQVGGRSAITSDEFALLWVLNLADGEHSLLDMAARSGMSFKRIADAADALTSAALLTDPNS